MTEKKISYVKNRLKGMNKTQAALAADYSPSTARNAGVMVETPDVKNLFQSLIQRRITPEKIAQRLEEGMDAIQTMIVGEGEPLDVINYRERREYLKLAAEYGGYHQAVKPADPTDGSKTQNNFFFVMPQEIVQ